MLVRLLVCLALITSCSLIAEAQLPKPDATLSIPMRDNTVLLTDLYLPENHSSNLPCILIRSPAGRHHPIALSYVPLAQGGYVVAIQETRSASDPEGKTFPYWNDGWGQEQDGFDTVEWLAKSSYTNGKIGTVGVSALGITQLMMGPAAPPSLVCQHVGMATGSLYHHALRPGGQFLKNQVEGWLNLYASDPGVFSYASSRPFYNEFWQGFDTCAAAANVKVPGLLYTGWYDTFLQGTIDAFATRQYEGGDGAKGQQKLIIGPWTHYWPYSQQLGDFEVPAIGQAPPVDMSPLSWFNHYLRGQDSGFNAIAAVNYFVMGPLDGTASGGNVWKTSSCWPVPCKMENLYLSTDNELVNYNESECQYPFVSDPNHPVPTVGGRNLFLESGPKDQSEIEKREDVLVFTTDALEQEIEVTGRIYAKLFVSSDCCDTDVVVRFTDVYPDGRSILIADGIYRLGFDNITQNGEVYRKPREVEIDLWSTSLVFAKDHKIRISISGSNYPRYEVNTHVGFVGTFSGSGKVAKNTIHVGKEFPSRLVLPVIEAKK